MISYSLKKRIVEETNIVEIVGEVVSLQKKGSSYFGLCPFHNDKHPSMSVNNEVKMFNCFSCNTKGNVIQFYSKFHHVTEDEATISLAKRLGIQVSSAELGQSEKNSRLYLAMSESTKFYQFYLKNSEEGKKALAYLQNRAIDAEIIDQLQLGLSPSYPDYLHQALTTKKITDIDQLELGLIHQNEKNGYYDVFRNRIMFPICNISGQVIGFSGRIFVKSDTSKYVNSSESAIFHKGNVLWNLNRAASAAKKEDKVIIFEGFMDVIAAMKAGIEYGVATMGTALTPNHVKELLSLTKNIILCFDGDEAGINAMNHSAKLLAQFGIVASAAVIPEELDPDDFLQIYGKKALKDFFDQNTKSVYEWLYLLAKKDLLKVDIKSVEIFKNKIFEFIGESFQETIISYYLKKMSEELEIPFESLQKDYQNSAYSHPSRISMNVTEHSSQNNSYQSQNNQTNMNQSVSSSEVISAPSIPKKQVKVTKKLLLAYQLLLNHVVHDRQSGNKYVEEIMNEGFDVELLTISELADEIGLMNLLLLYYQTHPEKDSIEKNDFVSTIVPGSSMEKEWKKMSNTIICLENKQEFDDCIKVVINHVHKMRSADLFNRAISSGDDLDVIKFVDKKKETVTIIQKEE
jgi:DNA primase